MSKAVLLGCTFALEFAGCSSMQSMVSMDASPTSPGPCHAFDDHSATSADRTVEFGGQGKSGPFSYSPMCMKIGKGQSVNFSGDFSVHPLTPGNTPGSPDTGSPDNPIHPGSGNGMVTIVFPNAGSYPYYCSQHFAAGMVGAIEVGDVTGT